MAKVTELNINGKPLPCNADADRSLLSVLRDDLELTGAKYGCGEGECGACTVLLEGSPVRSCMMNAGDIGSRKVTTIESLEQNGKLHPLQQAFVDLDAMQCAYCTGGMIMSALALLKKNPNPNREEIVRGMQGNICRCGTYDRIIDAITRAAKAMKEAR
jgi:aerobic-type carbon monoxide dehydrogenase small subunit (CoxS/CutS family)